MKDVYDRLVWLRSRHDRLKKSKRVAADAYGIGYEVYKKIETRENARNLTSDQTLTIARFHKVSPGWLMFGEGKPAGLSGVRLIGEIGAGQEIHPFADDGAYEPVAADIGNPDAVAFQVKGDSMLPLARNNDLIFVGPEQKDITQLIGRECAVMLEDGRRFFKVIENGSKRGRHDLISYNAEPIRDVTIHSAGLFLGLKRNGH
ncbi:S24 family peptidase [Bradyrhizobium barranii subsp. barranii]|uniref:S24 family peptidase n=1 Tax=Bradyrhizobium barranii subsp. barranii TaxID=2823807 RepID=A0A939S555_9BRAD|nr:S24 family peptidase [Bradyrhizobium barranii]UEM09043.1 S24 family peptidase [Bradyrhizobium barranii subsp. barranii]